MTLTRLRFSSLFLVFILVFPQYSLAFETPLSDTAIRDAYFLGQRHDDSLAQLLNKHVLYLQPPESGPYIQSISFLTPFVLTAINSSEHAGIYSAQQAQLDHDKTPELVRVTVQILLTNSYGPFTVQPVSSDSHSPKGFVYRPSDFWRDFRLRLFQKDKMVLPLNAKGEPTFRCDDDGCILTGATLTFEFPADAFTDDTATVQVTPPEGDVVSVDFDPTSFR
jgi:hypothetical protein